MEIINRREFVANACKFCLLAVASATFLYEESCKTPEKILSLKSSDGILKIPVSDFHANKTMLVKSDIFQEKILVIKKSENEYAAVLMKCTHKGVELVQKEGLLVCNAHGSRFDFNGNVISSPAKQPLRMFPVSKQGSDLMIHLS